jgi:methyl-accepting chemotaxis protein
VSDIADASAEQASGIEQVNKALSQMDEVTQQNSALVEENAATAKTLEHQANAMNERVAAFQIGGADAAPPVRELRQVESAKAKPRSPAASKRAEAAKPQPVAAPKRVAAGANGAGPAPRMQAAIAAAINHDQDWKEF